jgi:hypothetical protein
MVRIAESIEKFNADPSASALMMANGAFGGAMLVASAFSTAQSDGMGQQIRAVSQQVESLRQDLAVNFHIINKKLDLLFEGISQNLSALADLKATVNDVKYNLSGLRDLVGMLEENITNILSDIENLKSEASNLKCLGHKIRFPGRPLTGQEFEECINQFFFTATTASKSIVHLPPGSFLDTDVAGVLARSPSQTLRYIIDWAGSRYARRLAPALRDNVANVAVWASAAETYMRFARDWPELFSQMNAVSDLSAMIDVGRTTRSAIETLRGADASERSKLVSAALQDYEGALKDA